jgi:hypothetical protein
VLPQFAVGVFLVLLYVFKLIPPVPLAAKYMGIYHNIERENGAYKLSYTRPTWKFWQNGDQSFVAIPGDKIHCFVQIFSPSSIDDRVIFHWQFQTERGWQSSDRIAINVKGGRDDGFRGYSIKSAFQPGDWRVSVESMDGREIGRINFTVLSSATSDREFKFDYR